MQNAGLALIGANSPSSVYGFRLFTIGSELRAAGFKALGIALSAIYADTAASLFKITGTFGGVKISLSVLKGELEIQGNGFKRKAARTSPFDKLIDEYISDAEKLLSFGELNQYITKGGGNFEAGATRSAKLAQTLIDQAYELPPPPSLK